MKPGAFCTDGTAEIYRKAANRIAEDRSAWSCCAIERVLHGEHSGPGLDWSAPTIAYRKVFSDQEDGWLSITAFDLAGGKPVRILALCFMAAMVEAGDA